MYRFVLRNAWKACVLVALSVLCGVTDSFAQCDTVTRDFTFSIPSGCAPKRINFNVTPKPASSDSLVFYWDFGAGYQLAGPATGYTFSAGSKTVKLRIQSNKTGYAGTVCQTITKSFVLKSLPTPSFTADKTTFCTGPYTVKFTDNTVLTGSALASRKWVISGPSYSRIDSVGASVTTNTVTFPGPGAYDVLLYLKDSSGCETYTLKTGYINIPAALSADFCSELTEGAIGRDSLYAKFTPKLTSGAVRSSYGYVWNFGNGQKDSTNGPTVQNKIYPGVDTIAAPKTVTLTVYAANGCSTTITQKDIITKYYKLMPAAQRVGCPGSPITFQVTDAGMSNKTLSLATTAQSTVTKRGTRFYDIKFANPGTSDVRLSWSQGGCQSSLVIPKYLRALNPKAGFTSTDNKSCGPKDTVHFTASSKSVGSTYTWYLLDTSKTPTVLQTVNDTLGENSFIINSPGMYSVALKITTKNPGALTCSDSANRWGYIFIAAPTVDFSFPATTVCAGTALTPKAKVSPNDTPSVPYTYQWRATHTTKSVVIDRAGKSPSIVLDTPGVYDIKLTVINGVGCQNFKEEKSHVTINGVVADANFNTTSFCPPVNNADLQGVLRNVIPASSATKLTWQWDVSPTTGVTVTNATKQNAKVSISGVGTYDVTLTVTDTATKCSTVVSKPGMITLGTKADFSVNPLACLNTAVQLNNSSQNQPDTFTWKVTSQPSGSNAIFIGAKLNTGATESYDINPKISFDKVGTYKIQLQSGKQAKSSCVDTVSRFITITQPTAGFFSNDTLKICAPQFAYFKSTTPGMRSYKWNFGDDTKWYSFSTVDAYHNYSLNSVSGYDVTLVVESPQGCVDTLKKKGYIKLVGPEPKFTITPKRGLCGDGSATITNTSKNIVKFTFDYKDGSDLDTIPFTSKTHTYRYSDFTKDSITYYPDLTTSDSSANPCYSTYRDSITLYRPPIAKFNATGGTLNNGKIEGCAPFMVNFTDDSRYNTKAYFDFDGNGTYDDSVAAGLAKTFAYTTAGTYSVRIKATNPFCSDTSSKMFYIIVKPAPKADFTADKTLICPNSDVVFNSSTTTAGTGSTGIALYSWEFGDTSSSTDQNPTHRYVFDGYKNVKLVVTNNEGCADSTIKTNLVYVSSGTTPVTPIIRVVSVDTAAAGNGATRVAWEKYAGNPLDFSGYAVLKSGFSAPVFTTTDVNTTSYADIDPSIDVYNSTYTYKVRVTNPCGIESVPSDSHTTVNLTITPNASGLPAANTLTWNAYSGWNLIGGPRYYEVYRRDSFANGFGYNLVGTVPGNLTSFLDTGLCYKTYYYVVVAVHPVDVTIRSLSNKAQQRPNYNFQVTPLVLRYATVSGQSVLVKWESGVQRNIRKYIIERKEMSDPNSSFVEVGVTDPFTTTFVDDKVKTDASSYRYRVIVEDRCGNRTDGQNGAAAPSNDGTTILLAGDVDKIQDQYIFGWNGYEYFETGLLKYYLQLRDNQGNWNIVRDLGAANASYYDSVHSELDGAACFRVLAVSNPSASFPVVVDSSASNESCLILPSRVFIPNAFTPGVSKDINDQFGLTSVSIFNNVSNENLRFSLEVFDRWGQRVYETNDKKKGWDGTRNGVNCPEGVYIYKIKAQGMDRQPFFKTGYINLVH